MPARKANGQFVKGGRKSRSGSRRSRKSGGSRGRGPVHLLTMVLPAKILWETLFGDGVHLTGAVKATQHGGIVAGIKEGGNVLMLETVGIHPHFEGGHAPQFWPVALAPNVGIAIGTAIARKAVNKFGVNRGITQAQRLAGIRKPKVVL